MKRYRRSLGAAVTLLLVPALVLACKTSARPYEGPDDAGTDDASPARDAPPPDADPPDAGCYDSEPVESTESPNPAHRTFYLRQSVYGGIRGCGKLAESVSSCGAFDQLRECMRARFSCTCLDGQVVTRMCQDVDSLTPFEKARCAAASSVGPEHPAYAASLPDGPLPTSGRKYLAEALCSTPGGEARTPIGFHRCAPRAMDRPTGYISCVVRHTFGEDVGGIAACSEVHVNDADKMAAFRAACTGADELRENVPCPRGDQLVMACQKRDAGWYVARYYYFRNFPFQDSGPAPYVEGWRAARTHDDIHEREVDCLAPDGVVGVLYPWDTMPELFDVRGQGAVIFPDTADP